MLVLLMACVLGAGNVGFQEDLTKVCLDRVREIHGGTGPWAVAGYRMGERALKELKAPRHGFQLLVIHQAPAEVQYSCIADGLQAATGASPGKLNLKVEEAPADRVRTIIKDRKSGRTLTFALRPELARAITNLPHEELDAQGRRVASLSDDEIFVMTEGADREGGDK